MNTMSKLLLSPALLVFLASPLLAQDRCSDILRAGIYDTMVTNQKAVSFRQLQTLYRTESSAASGAKSALDLFALTPKGNVNLDWNNMTADQRQQALLDYKWEETFTDDSLYKFAQTVNATLVNAWTDCMRARALKFTYRASDDDKHVLLVAENSIPGINKLHFAGTTLKKQIRVLPPSALNCHSDAFEQSVQESTISCDRRTLTQRVTVKLLTTQGGQPTIELPAHIQPAPPPTVPNDVPLTEKLIASKTFAIVFRPVQSVNRAFASGVTIHPPNGVGLLTIAIPTGARWFTGHVIWFNDAPCDRSNKDQDPAVVIFRLAGREIATYTVDHFDPRVQDFAIDVRKIPEGAKRVIDVSVDPLKWRTCDHVALADPLFTFRLHP